MRKPGIFYGGYDEANLPFIERPVRELVRAMNAIPYIITYSSCGGHPQLFYDETLAAHVDFEVNDQKAAKRLYRRILYQNWVLGEPKSWVDISRTYANTHQYDRLDIDNPTHDNRLIWSESMTIRGFGQEPVTARRQLRRRITELTDLFRREVSR